MPGWDNFFVAQVGASAALIGLVFVGISINLSRIIGTPGLTGRAVEAIASLVQVLTVGTLMLVPDQSTAAISLELIAVGLAIWLTLVTRQVLHWFGPGAQYRRYMPVRVALGQAAVLPMILAGVLLQTQGEGGFFWVVPGILFSYLVALLNGWVLLIEINR